MCTFYFQIWKALGYGVGFDMFVTESGFPKASGHSSSPRDLICPFMVLTFSCFSEDPVFTDVVRQKNHLKVENEGHLSGSLV